MPQRKNIKTGAYFRRLQVKYRRRREGKTDYYARKALIMQDQRTINTPKHRLVVRRTNRDIICQIVMAHIRGDTVMCSAYSRELKRYGIPVGLTNYAACYATGLLLARRLLQKIKLDSLYKGFEKVTGEHKEIEAIPDKPRPFKAFLDVGLARTTTGARVFAALKGAIDGGLYIPASPKRYVGFNRSSKKLNATVLRGHIFGSHVAEYMRSIQGNEALYKARFGNYIKQGITADKLEKMYTDAHKAIRADPSAKLTEKKRPAKEEQKIAKNRMPKMTLEARRLRRQQRLDALKKRLVSVDQAVLADGGDDE